MKTKCAAHFEFEDMPVGMLLFHIARIHMDGVRHSLEGCGIQKTYGPILKELSLNEGMTQIELAGNMRITASSMSVSLQKMENAGLLTRRPDDIDMRQIKLYLTEKGKAMADKAHKEIMAAEKKLIETLSPDEQKELKCLLTKIIKDHSGRLCKHEGA